MSNPNRLAFEEWADDRDPRHWGHLPGPYSERENPEWCVICGAPYVTCKGVDHDGNHAAQDPQESLDHYAEVFADADREAGERIAGIRAAVRRDLDPDGDEFFIPFD